MTYRRLFLGYNQAFRRIPNMSLVVPLSKNTNFMVCLRETKLDLIRRIWNALTQVQVKYYMMVCIIAYTYNEPQLQTTRFSRFYTSFFSMPTVSSTPTSRVSFASLTPNNLGTVRKLNSVLFPIKYSEKFYQDILLWDVEEFCKLGSSITTTKFGGLNNLIFVQFTIMTFQLARSAVDWRPKIIRSGCI